MTEAVPYQSPAPRREKSLWLWVAIYAGVGSLLIPAAMGWWKVMWWMDVVTTWRGIIGWRTLLSWALFIVLSVGSVVAFSMSLACIQRMIERMPKQWVWALTMLTTGIAAAGMLTSFYFDARKNDPASRMRLLIFAIAVGFFGVLLLGQAVRSSRLAADIKLRPRWAAILWSVSDHLIIAIQLLCAAAAIGAGIVMGFGYPVP